MSKGVDDLPQLESHSGNYARLTAVREAKRKWTLISQTDLAMDHRVEAGASDGFSLMIFLGDGVVHLGQSLILNSLLSLSNAACKSLSE